MEDSERQRLFDEMANAGEIPVNIHPFFSRLPAGRPRWERLEGMLLGIAIGDALGNSTEGMTPAERARSAGEVRDYLPNRHSGGERKGTPSDDTQLTFWTLERLLADQTLDLDSVAQTFASRRVFGIGSSILEFASNVRDGMDWHLAAPRSAGNGALMRIAAVLLLHAPHPTGVLWRDAALLARLTHNDSASVMSCLAFVSLLWDLTSRADVPPSEWWIDTFVELLAELDVGRAYSPRGGTYLSTDTFSAGVAERLRDAQKKRLSAQTACQRFYSGAYLLETVPCVVYILSKHGHDPEEAIVRAVNDTKDNDTIAAIVGAAVGALHGRNALPRRWVENLSGRTATGDDGFVFDLIAQAERAYNARSTTGGT